MDAKKILVVEDIEIERKWYEAALFPGEAGIQLLLAADQREAEEILQRDKIDFVLTDLHIPPDRTGSEGFEVIVKAREIYPDIPVAIISSYPETSEKKSRAEELGVLDYINRAEYTGDFVSAETKCEARLLEELRRVIRQALFEDSKKEISSKVKTPPGQISVDVNKISPKMEGISIKKPKTGERESQEHFQVVPKRGRTVQEKITDILKKAESEMVQGNKRDISKQERMRRFKTATRYYEQACQFLEHSKTKNENLIRRTKKRLHDALFNLGLSHALGQNYQHAIDNFTQAMEIEPRDTCCLYYLGCAYIDNYEYEKAIETLKACLEKSHDRRQISQIENALGVAYELSGDRSTAAEIYERAAREDFNNEKACRNYWRLHSARSIAHEVEGHLRRMPSNIEELADLASERTTDYSTPQESANNLKTEMQKSVENAIQESKKIGILWMPKMEPVDLIKDILNPCIATLETEGIEVKKSFTHEICEIKANVEEIKYVITNVLRNAKEAMKGKGRILVCQAISEKKNVVYIDISNTGEKLPEELWEQVFQLRYSTKDGQQGIGLYEARSRIREHRGYIHFFKPYTGYNTTLRIILPRNPEKLQEYNSQEDKSGIWFDIFARSKYESLFGKNDYDLEHLEE